MFKKINFIFAGVCVAFLFSMNSFALDFNPGEYQITSKVKMQGMPSGMPAQTITECVSEQDLIPKSDSSGQDCEIHNMEQKGNVITWEMECNQEGQKITSQGKMVYSGDSFEGTITTKMGPQAGNMIITTEITGERTGSCKNSE